MSEFHALCTGQQYEILNQNVWKYTQIKGNQIRILPGTSEVSVIPSGEVKFTAVIEKLDSHNRTWGEADAANKHAQVIIETLFERDFCSH